MSIILIMDKELKELLHHIESIIWDPRVTDTSKVNSIQNLLYQHGANQDHRSGDLFDEHK